MYDILLVRMCMGTYFLRELFFFKVQIKMVTKALIDSLSHFQTGSLSKTDSNSLCALGICIGLVCRSRIFSRSNLIFVNGAREVGWAAFVERYAATQRGVTFDGSRLICLILLSPLLAGRMQSTKIDFFCIF